MYAHGKPNTHACLVVYAAVCQSVWVCMDICHTLSSDVLRWLCNVLDDESSLRSRLLPVPALQAGTMQLLANAKAGISLNVLQGITAFFSWLGW